MTSESPNLTADAAPSDLQLLIDLMPDWVRRALYTQNLDDLIEVVLDLGRPAEARFVSGQMIDLAPQPVGLEDLQHVVKQVGYFSADNRAGIPRTLHRISAMRNRQGEIIGLTCRVGKVVTGTITPIRDLVESGRSLLLLGRPGVGKTTMLREIAKLLADETRRRVVIVDTANEIAGDGDIPHPAVGRARRIQVPTPDQQKAVMIEAVQNHTPEVIVVDEIGTEDEALASRTIAERGVILVATAHGTTLESVIKNPMLSDLVGGIQSVTLGDDEAKRRASQKTVLEREKKPTFDVAIEIRDRSTLAVYPDVAEAVDHLLRGWTLFPEVRKFDASTGTVRVLQPDQVVMDQDLAEGQAQWAHPRDQAPIPVSQQEFRVFIYGIGKGFVDRILERLNLHHVRVTKNIHDAHAVVLLRGNARPGSKILQLAQDYDVPVFIARANTMPQIQRAVREALAAVTGQPMGEDVAVASSVAMPAVEGEEPLPPAPPPFEDETESALREAEEAIELVEREQKPVELTPRRSYIRRLQHELVERHGLMSFSVGDEPNRRLKLVPAAQGG